MIGRRRPRAHGKPSDVVSADAELVRTLDALDGASNYRDWIIGLSEQYLRGAERLLEVGAGHGTFTGELSAFGHVTAVELGGEALERLSARYAGVARVTVSRTPIEEMAADAFDAAFLSNVLEHIEDDRAALRQLARIVRSGGHVIVFSPAFPLLYSDFDARIGHHHRYRLRNLQQSFEQAGMKVVEARYVNSVGFFSWLVLVRLFGLTPERSALVSVFDRWFIPTLRRVERRWPPPFGQSVLVVGTPVA